MIKATLCAALLVAASATGSVALPASGGALAAPDTANIIQVKNGTKHWGQHRSRPNERRHWRRHHSPPPGWHRYHHRPWDWQRRGCTLIGPVWFCP